MTKFGTADAEQRDDADRLIDGAVFVQRREDAEWHADRHNQEQRGHGDLGSNRQTLPDQQRDGLARGVRHAQITVDDPTGPGEVLDWQWLVERELVANRRDHVRAGFQAGLQLRGVARRQPQQANATIDTHTSTGTASASRARISRHRIFRAGQAGSNGGAGLSNSACMGARIRAISASRSARRWARSVSVGS